jgi:hypothetical protein
MACGCSQAGAGGAPGAGTAYAKCAIQTLRFNESQVSNYADRVGAQGGTNNWVRCYVIACLVSNRIIYYKQSPNDCGLATAPPSNLNAQLAQAGARTALSAVPIVGNALAALVSALPFAHHAQAVETEQTTLCNSSSSWNQFADQIEQALAGGTIGLQDATTKMQQVVASLKGYTQKVVNGINAGYGVEKALDALALFNAEVVYPSLVPGVASSILGTSSPLAAVTAPVTGIINSIAQALGLAPTPPSAVPQVTNGILNATPGAVSTPSQASAVASFIGTGSKTLWIGLGLAAILAVFAFRPKRGEA